MYNQQQMVGTSDIFDWIYIIFHLSALLGTNQEPTVPSTLFTNRKVHLGILSRHPLVSWRTATDAKHQIKLFYLLICEGSVWGA